MSVAIHGRHLSFSYDGIHNVWEDVSFSVEEGQWVAILGTNGSGKSTLVRVMDALLPIAQGELSVLGMDVRDKANHPSLRRQVGIVFQNPQEQCVASFVEDDIAFGLENYRIPETEIASRIGQALHQVGLDGYGQRDISSLSGGQMQKVALAGALALRPKILILDEATSMLDPMGRSALLRDISRLHNNGMTIIMVTHMAEEAVNADRIIVLGDKTIKAEGTPAEVFRDEALLERCGLMPPLPVRLWTHLGIKGTVPLTGQAFVEAICGLR